MMGFMLGTSEKAAQRPLFRLLSGGEGGIRTLGTETVRLISSQVHSTTLPPLRIVESAIVAGFLGPHEKFTLKYAEIYATKRSKPPR